MTTLIIAAHPDDEVLGVAGTARHMVEHGEAVHVLIMAQGSLARGLDTTSSLKEAAYRASHIIGTALPIFCDLPDNEMDTVSLLVTTKTVEAVIHNLKPETVFTHWGHDLNVDHERTHRAVITACRPGLTSVKRIYSFETVSATEWVSPDLTFGFQPQVFIGIDLEKKLEAVKCYQEELRAFPHSRSLEAIEALAKWRGACGGLPAAEAFRLIRSVEI